MFRTTALAVMLAPSLVLAVCDAGGGAGGGNWGSFSSLSPTAQGPGPPEPPPDNSDLLAEMDANGDYRAVRLTGFEDGIAMACDGVRDRILVLDRHDRLLAAEPSDGTLSTVSSPDVGSGPPLTGAVDFAIDTKRDRAIVLGGRSGTLYAVNLTTGDRSVLSDVYHGMGYFLAVPQNVAYDAAGDRILVLNSVAVYDLLVEVDPETGQSWTLSGRHQGSGPTPGLHSGLALDFAGGRAFTVDMTGLLQIDLVTGDRTRIPLGGSSALDGSGRMRVRDIVFDPASGRLYRVGKSIGFQEVDLATGKLTTVNSSCYLDGPAFFSSSAICHDADGEGFYVLWWR